MLAYHNVIALKCQSINTNLLKFLFVSDVVKDVVKDVMIYTRKFIEPKDAVISCQIL